MIGRRSYEIVAPRFTVSLEIRDGYCIQCAPKIKYMLGKSYQWIKSYCRAKMWDLDEVCPLDRIMKRTR